MDINAIIRNAIILILLVFAQVILLSNISISFLEVSPHLYILFILLLPLETAGWIILLLAFFIGFTIDTFLDTIAVHTSATLFLAFLRPLVIRILSPRTGYEYGITPSVRNLSFSWFLKYTAIMAFIHHLSFVMIEVFSFKYFHLSVLKILISSVFTTILIMLSQFFDFRGKSKE